MKSLVMRLIVGLFLIFFLIVLNASISSALSCGIGPFDNDEGYIPCFPDIWEPRGFEIRWSGLLPYSELSRGTGRGGVEARRIALVNSDNTYQYADPQNPDISLAMNAVVFGVDNSDDGIVGLSVFSIALDKKIADDTFFISGIFDYDEIVTHLADEHTTSFLSSEEQARTCFSLNDQEYCPMSFRLHYLIRQLGAEVGFLGIRASDIPSPNYFTYLGMSVGLGIVSLNYDIVATACTSDKNGKLFKSNGQCASSNATERIDLASGHAILPTLNVTFSYFSFGLIANESSLEVKGMEFRYFSSEETTVKFENGHPGLNLVFSQILFNYFSFVFRF